ncbi:uncharacterized protein LTR77_001050 [Saxophila tyrrhenica]|uniref:Peptidase S59 domain-containing protein n=1 Tax=Saxophila tyrrhenica TaxID=1690608 RepID=A0AAV9PJQ5_9PEZI|nr:hypothetical protein LTR77_001050 [Saxophila tyrrhenica]
MSFGFGSNNNNANTGSTFGGFGSSNTGGGFGATNNASTGGSLFGGNTATSGGFGGFGSTANTSSPFGGGSKPAFGAPATTSSGGGMFGNNANTTTSGGFGSGGGFGASTNTGGFGGTTGGGKEHHELEISQFIRHNTNIYKGLFGQNKPATGGFGSSNTGGSLFGGGNTGGGFGSTQPQNNNNPFSTNPASNTNTGFGASNAGGSGFTFGGAASNTQANNNNNNNNNGTANTPFQPVTEKDPGASTSSAYQSITMQPPYNGKSFEELRVEDYAQGRRFGNSNGQAGSFGQSTGFGGFGANNNNTSTAGGGLFGGNNTATAGGGGFGSNTGGFGSTNTGGGFGSTNNTGGGLFGSTQNKPATGGLFGASNTSGTTTGGFGSTANNTGGGLFGGGGGGGFGASTTQNNNTGGGLFGNNNNQQQQQNKPAFGGFGASTTNTNTGGGYGSTNTGGGLFGGSQQNTGGGLFGGQQNQQQNQQSNPFGASNTNTGGGLFGNNQNKPASGGLFGNNPSTNTGGGLFGGQNNNNNNQQQQSNPFGASQNTGGGLFGNQNQNKPQGTGLFGSSTTNTNTGGGLFGGQNNNQQGSGGLFGGGNNNNTGGGLFGSQNKPAGGLFGGSTSNQGNTGSGLSLFGGNNQQNQQNNGGGLFGGSLGQNQNQNSTTTNSLFGGSLGQSQQATPQNQLHASLTNAPYGNEQLFSSLAAPSPPVGPLATPLTGARPAPRKTPSLLTSARANTPVYSPRGSTTGGGGYGFSYSTYGTPGSAFTSGSLTPIASSLLRPTGSLSSALTGRLNKSFSTSNLRGDATPGLRGSLLRPSTFSPNGTPGSFQSGSMRRLKIDRSLRTDLFGPAEPPSTVETPRQSRSSASQASFQQPSAQQSTAAPSNSNALVRTEEEEEPEQSTPPALMRAAPGRSQQPEMEQANGNTLTTVPEHGEAPRPTSAPSTKAPAPAEKSLTRNEAGEYWTKPAMKDLKNMSRQQLENIGNFVVGRDGIGRIEFGAVDLTNTQLDTICGDIVKLTPRSATVYEDDANKPSMGKALNVPSTIHLEQSWPRSNGGQKALNAKSGRAYDKHIARLKRVNGTHFVNYNPDTGIWTFTVDHFTTYGLDDDDESEFDDDTQMQGDSSGLSDALATPTDQQDMTMDSVDTGSGEMDDTFQFQLDRRSQLNVPGGFGDGDGEDTFIRHGQHTDGEDEHMMSGGLGEMEEDSFMSSGGAVQAPSPGAVERYHSSMVDDDGEEAVEEEDVEGVEKAVPGSFAPEPKMPRSILKPITGLGALMSPEKLATETWEEQLQRTMSPRKRDRQALKEMQQGLFKAIDEDGNDSPLLRQSMLGRSALDQSYLAQRSAKQAKIDGKGASKQESAAFRGSMDLMKSLWGQDEAAGKKVPAAAKGFENPYPKRRRLSLRPQDDEWLSCLRPSINNDNTFMFAATPSSAPVSGELAPSRLQALVDHRKQVRFAGLVTPEDLQPDTLGLQQDSTVIDTEHEFAVTITSDKHSFATLAESVQPGLAISDRETSIWKVCSILFDSVEIACAAFIRGVPEDRIDELEPRMRMDALAAFWTQFVESDVEKGLKSSKTAEEKALLYLTRGDVVTACEILVQGRCFKLAALVAQLPGSDQGRAMTKQQIGVWRERKEWSEFGDAVRALYSVLAGECCVVEGQKGPSEDRAGEFHMAERFGLSWRQSFALRLLYGGRESIGYVVKAYMQDLNAGREVLQPTQTWADLKETTDTLLELLRVAAGGHDAAGIFNAKAVSGAHFDSRLAWQMACLLHVKGIISIPDDRMDTLTLDFATELEAAGHLTSSVWILLHIRDTNARVSAVAGMLQRNAGRISEPVHPQDENTGSFDDLREHCYIPSSMLWKAKALYAQSVLCDPALQTFWLIKAGLSEEAHDVLCTTLGPKAVIEQDYTPLSRVLAAFPTREVEGWRSGGAVYTEFVKLVRAREARKGLEEAGVNVARLRKGLGMLHENLKGGGAGLEERVAVVEMGKVVEEAVREEGMEGEGHRRAEMGGKAAGMWERYSRTMGVVG